MNGTIYGPNFLKQHDVLPLLAKLPESVDGRRVWARLKDENVGYVYVSCHPGGFRTEPPPSTDLVHDIPDDQIRETYLPTLKSTVQRFADNESLSAEIDAANRLLDGTFQSRSRRMLNRFENLYRRSPRDARQILQSDISELYTEGLFEYGMSLVDFSAALALCQLYISGVAKVSDGLLRGDNFSNLRAVAADANSNPEARASTSEFLEYTHAEALRHMQFALEATSLMEHHRHAYAAAHFLFTTMAISRDFDWGSRSYHQLDEAYACSIEFLGLADNLYPNNPFDVAQTYVPPASADLADWKGALRFRLSSLTHPTLPTYLFDLFSAYAEFRWHIQQEDESHEQSLSRFSVVADTHRRKSVEVDTWNDLIIREAARQVGNKSERDRRTKKIVSRFVVGKLLGAD